MRGVRAGGRAGGRRTLYRAQRVATCQTLNVRRQKTQCSLVRRLFLHPEKLARITVPGKSSFQFRLRDRKELLHKEDRRATVASPFALPPQFMADLTGAENDPLAVADLRV